MSTETAPKPLNDTASPEHPAVAGCAAATCSGLVADKVCFVTWQHGVEPGIFKRWATLSSPKMDWHHAIVATLYEGEVLIRRIELHNIFERLEDAHADREEHLRKIRDHLNAMNLGQNV